MARRYLPDCLTIAAAVHELTVDELKPLVRLLGKNVNRRKGDLVGVLTSTLTDPVDVRGLYDGLDNIAKRALEEAAHDPAGRLNLHGFRAKYGQSPDFGGRGRYRTESQPSKLRLFFPQHETLPSDLHELLLEFIPEPPPLIVEADDDLPANFQRPCKKLGPYYREPDKEDVSLQVRQTARAALQEVEAVLRLIDAGEVRVGEKTHRPSATAIKAIQTVLTDGEFYAEGDRSDYSHDPGSDLVIKSFA